MIPRDGFRVMCHVIMCNTMPMMGMEPQAMKVGWLAILSDVHLLSEQNPRYRKYFLCSL